MMRRPGHKFSRSSLAEYLGLKNERKPSESLLRNIRTLESAAGMSDESHNEVLANIANHRRESIELESRIDACLKPYLEDESEIPCREVVELED